jgi:hypothetical protein
MYCVVLRRIFSIYIAGRWVPKPGHPCASPLPVISATNLKPIHKPNVDLKSTPDGTTCQYHRHPRRMIPRRLLQLLLLMLQHSASLVQPLDYSHLLKSAPFCPIRTSWIQFTPPHVRLMRSFLILQPHLLFGSDDWLAAGSSISCLTYTCCCMYSLELLMMDGKTVRNMYSVMQK